MPRLTGYVIQKNPPIQSSLGHQQTGKAILQTPKVSSTTFLSGYTFENRFTSTGLLQEIWVLLGSYIGLISRLH